jgi:hypothetical protein
MDAHRKGWKASLQDAGTKQYDSAVESAKQFGGSELREVFTADEKKRCRLDGGEDEDGTRRLPDVDVVPTPEPGLVSVYFASTMLWMGQCSSKANAILGPIQSTDNHCGARCSRSRSTVRTLADCS